MWPRPQIKRPRRRTLAPLGSEFAVRSAVPDRLSACGGTDDRLTIADQLASQITLEFGTGDGQHLVPGLEDGLGLDRLDGVAAQQDEQRAAFGQRNVAGAPAD